MSARWLFQYLFFCVFVTHISCSVSASEFSGIRCDPNKRSDWSSDISGPYRIVPIFNTNWHALNTRTGTIINIMHVAGLAVRHTLAIASQSAVGHTLVCRMIEIYKQNVKLLHLGSFQNCSIRHMKNKMCRFKIYTTSEQKRHERYRPSYEMCKIERPYRPEVLLLSIECTILYTSFAVPTCLMPAICKSQVAFLPAAVLFLPFTRAGGIYPVSLCGSVPAADSSNTSTWVYHSVWPGTF